MTWISRHRNALGFAGCILILLLGFVTLAIGITRAKDTAKANRRAIFVSCTLLANTIIQAGGSQNDESTRLFVIAIRRVMTPAEQKRFDRAMAARRSSGGTGLTIPPCKKIASHPEEVQPIQLPPTATRTPTATRSP